MVFIKANGIQISYESIGEGEPLFLIHGYGAKKEVWKPQAQELSKRFRVIIYDIRGVGKSERPNYPYTMEMLADDLKGLMDVLKIKKAHVGGRSLGGMIAQNFCLKYPERVEKLIIMTSNMGMPDESAVNMMIESQVKDSQQLTLDPETAFWNQARLLYHRSFIKQMKENPKKSFFNSFTVEDLIKEGTIDPPREQDIRNLGSAIKGHDTRSKLKQIKNKTLLIAASHDRLTPKATMEEMNELIPNSILKIIDNAGHYVNVSNAAEVNQIILDFLNS